ncbi:hypothetical protein ScPMuIL_015991 [Solemya velum]
MFVAYTRSSEIDPMAWSDGGWHWPLLALLLFLFTFGSVAILIVLYFAIFIIGCLIIAYFYGKQMSLSSLQILWPCLQMSRPGLTQVIGRMENITKSKNFDRRMTGAFVIDEVLQEVLEYTIRDYIKSWYWQISDDDGFLHDIRQSTQKIAVSFASKTKDVNWMPYFTQRLVDDFASHIRLYRRAMDKCSLTPKEDGYSAQLESLFFDTEVAMENNMCRDLVCTSIEHERQYLQDLSEVLLFLLLPPEDFNNKPFRYLLREVLVNGIFIPTVDMFSDPDYINQTVAWLCKDMTFNNETFMTVIKTSSIIDELEAIEEVVETDILKWRSKDTGGSDDTLIKQNLNSLLFVKSVCEGRIKRLQSGYDDSDLSQEIPESFKAKNLFVLNLDEIVNNNVALTYFIEFLTTRGQQQYLYFYLNVEGFRTAAEQQISEAQQNHKNSGTFEPDLESLRQVATIIYDQYLSDKASSRIRVDTDFIKRALQKIRNKMMSEDVFDEVQARVYQILHGETYYESFLQSSLYIRLLDDLGLLSENHKMGGDIGGLEDVPRIIWFKSEDSGSISSRSNQSRSSSQDHSGEPTITAEVTQTGIVKEADKTYAIFAVTVKRTADNNEEISDVYRRYSDFHDLHMIVTEKFANLDCPSLPGKTVLKNMNKEFLEKRRKALNAYIQYLLDPEQWETYQGLKYLVMKFLAPGLWEKHKSDLARKMDTIVNPLKSSMRTVGNAVKHVPAGLRGSSHDGLSKGLTDESDIDPQTMDSTKVGAGLDPESEDNIPLRILLLLMDEVFDLKHKNQWLRRRLVTIMRQLIKATYGDRINRKIVDHVDWMTSAEQMAEYIKTFRDSFWPSGILAESRPERDQHTKMRTRVVCKAKMLGSIPDEMRTLMGTDTVKLGTFQVFEMFQLKNLNKRFVYVFLEGVIETLFPHNKFLVLFRKLHSSSLRLKPEQGGRKDSLKDTGVRKRKVNA